MIKAAQIEGSNTVLVNFPHGEYIVDKTHGVEAPYNGKKVEVGSVEDIRKVEKTSIADHFEDAEGNVLSVEEYNVRRGLLLSNATETEYGWEFEDLDDEYKFKKFSRTWKEIRRTVVNYSDPLPVEVTRVVVNTGNQYISPMFSVGGDPSLYIYNKEAAVKAIVREKFDELGMEFSGDVSYMNTKNKKVWGNSTHSGIRYVTAFNAYLFNDGWNFTKSPFIQGTLDYCRKRYEEHRKELREIIQAGYNSHFGNLDESKVALWAKDVLGELKSIQGAVESIDYKMKSRDDAFAAKKLIRELIERTRKALADD